MKLMIAEQRLEEDIEAVKKYYPNIDDDTFMQLISLDPTYKGKDSLGKYGKWILNLYKKGAISEDDFSEITPLLNQFTTYRNRITNKDLNAYKTLDDLSSILTQVVDDDSMLSDRQKLRFKKNVKAGRTKVASEDDYDIVFENNKYIVYVPNTHEASMKLGKGTEWCTAHENPDYFIGYTKNNGKLYIVKNKFTNEMWQFSDAFGDFLDEHDEDFDVMKLLNSDKDLKKFLMKLIGFIGDGEVLYQGATIPDELKDEVVTLRISDGVKYIKDYAFCNCKQLERVEIPGNVIDIGANAFYGCTRLASIIINEGVERICRGAFRNCAMSYIKLPNSISDIDYWAFHGCARLKSITIPENVRTLKEESFGDCAYLETVDIMDGVYEIQSKAFHNCKNLTSVKIPMSMVDISSYAFMGADDDKLTIYTDNDIIKPDIEKYTLFSIKPSSMFRTTTESLKLRISEDTACIPSKTSYVDEDGWDKNGIYYFGEKPKKPINWKDYKKGSNKKMITLESYLAEDSLDEYGMFVQLDDAMSGMINNVDDDEIDDAVRYFERVAGALGSKNRLSNVQCYFCNADWLNPSEQSYLRSEMKPLYKNGKYDSYVGTYNGKKFVVDKYSNNYDFTIYATDEQTIIDLIKDIEESY